MQADDDCAPQISEGANRGQNLESGPGIQPCSFGDGEKRFGVFFSSDFLNLNSDFYSISYFNSVSGFYSVFDGDSVSDQHSVSDFDSDSGHDLVPDCDSEG